MSLEAAEVAFVIANDRHHTSGALAVIEALRERPGLAFRALSIAELRGFESPIDRFQNRGVPIEPVLPFRFRKPASGSRLLSDPRGSGRSLLREAFWHLLLGPALRECLVSRPQLVVLPNDGAYPYDRICNLLTGLEIPFLVLQEGIRFSRPSSSQEGRSAASAWAVWGKNSATYFRAQGAPPAAVTVTGSPRFDELCTRDWSLEGEAVKRELAAGKPIVTLLSNPIDDLGLVTPSQKLELIRRLAVAAVPVLEKRGWHLVIKLHGRESAAAVHSALAGFPGQAPVSVVVDSPLYPLLAAARGALTFASSVGLEALLCGVPLAVVEIPGHGFVHDFVSSGAALGITWKEPISAQLDSWLRDGESPRVAVEDYLDTSVAYRGESAARVAGLVRRLLHEATPASR